jgi:hypothetical protein
MLTERKDTDPLPEWKLVRIAGKVELLTKNSAMRLMLAKPLFPTVPTILPEKS